MYGFETKKNVASIAFALRCVHSLENPMRCVLVEWIESRLSESVGWRYRDNEIK